MPVHAFGELEAVIMDRLWAHAAPMTVRQVLNELPPQRALAYNTVLTVVDNLFKKGWLSRRPSGRAFQYVPTVTRAEYGARQLRDALDGAGDPAETLLRFVGQMSGEETTALREALHAHEREGRR